MKDMLVAGVLCLLIGFTIGEKYNEIVTLVLCDCEVAPLPVRMPMPPFVPPSDLENQPEEQEAEAPPEQAVPVADMHLTLFLKKGSRFSAQYDQYIRWFDTHAGLSQLKAASNFNVMYTNDPRFARYDIEVIPAILLQSADGRVVYEASGHDFPNQADRLHEALAGGITACPWCRPRPQPTPAPTLIRVDFRSIPFTHCCSPRAAEGLDS
jgi:hypothetical protein